MRNDPGSAGVPPAQSREAAKMAALKGRRSAVSVNMARTPWLESACGTRRRDGDVGESQEALSSLARQGDVRLAASPAGVSLEAMSEGRYTHLARIGLLLVALILLGLFACPPRAYAQVAVARPYFAASFSTLP